MEKKYALDMVQAKSIENALLFGDLIPLTSWDSTFSEDLKVTEFSIQDYKLCTSSLNKYMCIIDGVVWYDFDCKRPLKTYEENYNTKFPIFPENTSLSFLLESKNAYQFAEVKEKDKSLSYVTLQSMISKYYFMMIEAIEVVIQKVFKQLSFFAPLIVTTDVEEDGTCPAIVKLFIENLQDETADCSMFKKFVDKDRVKRAFFKDLADFLFTDNYAIVRDLQKLTNKNLQSIKDLHGNQNELAKIVGQQEQFFRHFSNETVQNFGNVTAKLNRLICHTKLNAFAHDLKIERNTLLAQLQSSSLQIYSQFMQFQNTVEKLIDTLIDRATDCRIVGNEVLCTHNGAHFSDTDNLSIKIRALTVPYVIKPAQFIECLWTKDKKMYKYNNLLHYFNGTFYEIENTFFPKSCLTLAENSNYACEQLFDYSGFKPVSFKQLYYIRSQNGFWIQSKSAAVNLTVNGEYKNVGLTPIFISDGQFPWMYEDSNDKTQITRKDLMVNEEDFHVLKNYLLHDFSPSLMKKQSKISSIQTHHEKFRDLYLELVDIHENNPVFRNTLYASSTVGIIMIIIIVTLCVCCCCRPKCCNKCYKADQKNEMEKNMEERQKMLLSA